MRSFEKLLLFGRQLLAVGAVVGSTALAQTGQDPQLDTPSIQHGPIVVCFAEGTDEDYAQDVSSQVTLLNGTSYYLGARWSGAQGSPRALTWSLAPDGLSIPGGVGEATSNNVLFSSMDTKFAAQGGRATWIARLQSCFDRWQQVTGLTFTRVTSGGNDWDDGAVWGSAGGATRGDIRISAHNIDGVNGVLGYTEFPSGGDMVLDSSEGWGSSASLHRFLRNTVMHELGHAYGLAHVCSNNSNQLMEPFLSTSFDGPQHDDIRGCERHYGDPFEIDDAAGTANDLGTIASGATVSNTCTLVAGISGTPAANTSICSIDANGEADFFKFTVSSSAAVSVTVTPLGFSYDNTAQAGDGSCPSLTTVNSLSMANLGLEVRASNGTTILGSATAAAIGLPEALTNISVPSGLVFIRVFETDAPGQVQFYRLTISVQNSCTGLPDCNSNGVLDSCDIADGTSLDINGSNVPDECENLVANSFCFGDQVIFTFTPCPCDNAGALNHGCANSVDPNGALLGITGVTSPVDTLSLNCTGMPTTATAIFLKGDVNITNGITFGDGVRCVDNFTRMGTLIAAGGAASYPGPGQQIISIRGSTPIGSGLVGYYQTYYRNASATFCPPDTFNVSNGFVVTW